MKKEFFLINLKKEATMIQQLIDDGGVQAESALYGFLKTARMALTLAVAHIEEFREKLSEHDGHCHGAEYL